MTPSITLPSQIVTTDSILINTICFSLAALHSLRGITYPIIGVTFRFSIILGLLRGTTVIISIIAI